MIEFELIQPVDALLKRQAQAHGGKAAFHDSRVSLSYQDLNDRTARCAAALAHLAVRPGETVAIHLPNCVRWMESFFGIVRHGAIAVPISADSSADEVLYRLQDADCAVVVTTPSGARVIADLGLAPAALRHILVLDETGGGETHSGRTSSYEEQLQRAASPASTPGGPGGSDLDAPAMILYTSGTTGKAKGVVLTQRSMLWVVASCWAPAIGLGPGDHMLSPLPLFHSYGLNLVGFGTLATGATTRIMERFSTSEALALLQGGEFTVFPAVPTMFHYLLERAGDGTLDFGRLRVCISAGAIMPGALNETFERRTGVPLMDGYGITETSTMVTINWPGRPRVLGSCGLPLPGLSARIVDAATRDDVPNGKEGELIVRGPNLMLGYLNKPEETARALVGGWYLTGDLAVADAAGFLRITGRLKEIIIRGGQNIAPAEVEEVVLRCPPILDCAVVARQHPLLGEVPVLFVVPRAGSSVDEAAVKAYCSQRMSSYKVPEQVLVVESIPRTGSGKIRRFELANRLK